MQFGQLGFCYLLPCVFGGGETYTYIRHTSLAQRAHGFGLVQRSLTQLRARFLALAVPGHRNLFVDATHTSKSISGCAHNYLCSAVRLVPRAGANMSDCSKRLKIRRNAVKARPCHSIKKNLEARRPFWVSVRSHPRSMRAPQSSRYLAQDFTKGKRAGLVTDAFFRKSKQTQIFRLRVHRRRRGSLPKHAGDLALSW